MILFNDELPDLLNRDPRQSLALGALTIGPFILTNQHFQYLSVKSPDFGNPERIIDRQPIQGGSGNLDLYSQVGRRIGAHVKMGHISDQGVTPEIK